MKILVTILFFIIFNSTAYAAAEDAVFAVLKLSYNTPGVKQTEGGIIGTAFLINNTTILTAYHVLNEKIAPNPGFKHYGIWLLKRGADKLVIPLTNLSIKYAPNIDTTVIQSNTAFPTAAKLKLQYMDNIIGDMVYSFGHIGGEMPAMKAVWDKDTLVIQDYSIQDSIKADKVGTINQFKIVDVNTNDVNLVNKLVIKPSFGAIEGIMRQAGRCLLVD